MLNPDAAENVRRAIVKNVLKKVAAGKVPTQREQAILDGESSSRSRRGEPTEDGRLWLKPAELERWLRRQGLKISHQNLYKTYLGRAAQHAPAVPWSGDGERIHRDKMIELIRIVQQREDVNLSSALAEKQAANARILSAKARMAELELYELEGRKIDIALVKKVFNRAIQNFDNELRALELSLPDELVGLEPAAMREVLRARHAGVKRHLKLDFGKNGGPAENENLDCRQGH